ncbi:hypothetical protein AXF42_Ash005441 [Apostasia shenzhenica]|uniref:Uncharacterized protein n=1 Tax=Apostasia shenzhenica TaxID=1088818 RepID=A0A2I0B6X3_9ASPA|nr:hypothetical protein AXF42_Ash005441 [Apostasia shenzhenica]
MGFLNFSYILYLPIAQHHHCLQYSMADRPARRRPPFGIWFPFWTSPTRASPRPPPPQPEPPPPSTTSRTPSLAQSQQIKKVPSSSSRSGRRESILPLTMPGELPSAQGKSQVEFTKPEAQIPKLDTQPKIYESKEAGKAHKEIESKSYYQEEGAPSSEVGSKEVEVDRQKQVTRNQFLEPEDQLQKTQEAKPGKYIEDHIQKLEEERKEDAGTTREMASIKIAASERVREEFESKERKAETVEKQEERSNNQVIGESKNIEELKLSITVSDTKPEQKKQEEQEDRSSKEAKIDKQVGKESKITISTIPRTTSPNLPKDLKDGISKLAEKLKIGKQSKLGNEQGVNIITLAGENKGATMFIGYEGSREQKLEKGEGSIPSINSNVQGINNSLLDDTNYSESNPGVHFTISTKPDWPLGIKEKKEKNYSSLQPQKLTYDPNVRRRCLRGLFLEPSEDETESTQKPRRHGCRFSCDDKKKEKVEETGN